MSKTVVVSKHLKQHGSLRTYIIGYALSLYLTITAYLLVTHHVFATATLALFLGLLAIIQFIVQLKFFLHIGADDKPRWKLMVFYFMLLVVAIIVFGSLWIMNHLDYHMMQPAELKTHMRVEEGL